MSDEQEDVKTEVLAPSSFVEAQERAAIDVQISTAKRYPRSVKRFKDQVRTLATQSREVAEACWYVVPRAGQTITGPSVRLAEIVAASYQNLAAAARIVSEDDEWITAQGAVHDLENNVRILTEVRRRIVDSRGRRYSADMIGTTSNAACSIALRNAIFKVVPMALLEDLLPDIQAVGMGDARTIAETKKALIVYFKGMGATEEQVCALVEKPSYEDLTNDDIATLRGVATAIKEGTTQAAEVFGPTIAKGTNGKPLTPGRHKVEMNKPEPPAPAPVPKPEPEPENDLDAFVPTEDKIKPPEPPDPPAPSAQTVERKLKQARAAAARAEAMPDQPWLTLAARMDLTRDQLVPAGRVLQKLLAGQLPTIENMMALVDTIGAQAFCDNFRQDALLAQAVAEYIEDLALGREAQDEAEPEPEPEPEPKAEMLPDDEEAPHVETTFDEIKSQLTAWRKQYPAPWQEACLDKRIAEPRTLDLDTLTKSGVRELHKIMTLQLTEQGML